MTLFKYLEYSWQNMFWELKNGLHIFFAISMIYVTHSQNNTSNVNLVKPLTLDRWGHGKGLRFTDISYKDENCLI